MRSGKLLIIFGASLFVAGVLAVCFSPLLVAAGLRLWASRVARQGGLRIELGQIEAPFLGPVIIHDVHVTRDSTAVFQVNAATPRLEVDLNLAAMIGASDNRMLRALRSETITIDIRRTPRSSTTSQRVAWPLLQDLLADNFKLSGVQLHLENGDTTIDLRDGALSGSELEAGAFSAREVAIESPWLRKTFANLRGATSWQESRLVVGALNVMRGLDLDTITIDVAHLGESKLAMEIGLDAFGGKIRARISSEDHDGKRTWDVAGSGSEISIAQMSDALEWTNRASGSLHASKFTFRGELTDLQNATAALWAEVTGLTWRDRTADTLMIGASLYNREVQVEQLYIKQRNNQLTLSGEFNWPEKFTADFRPVFRGDLTASINDLGEFARLFGWSPPDFAGQLSANGSITASEGKLGGHLSLAGNSLVLFRSPIESLEVKLDLEESRVAITQLELRQTGDFFHGEGSFALGGDRAYSGAFQTSVTQIANYRGFIPSEIMPWPLEGSVAAEWKGRGEADGGSGTFQARAKNLRVANGPLASIDVDLEADYSPESIFFRQFHFRNEHADLTAFVGVAKNYVQAQGLRFDIDGSPRIYGNLFVPISARKLREGSSWPAALSADPFFDIDLTLDAVDLAELATAVETKPDFSGQANGKLQLSGTPASLQGTTELHLRDFVLDNSPALSADLDASLAFGMANLKANVAVRGSDPVKVEAAVPIQLEKRDTEFALASNGPLSATVNLPAIFLGNLPSFISRGAFTRGILSGSLNLADSVRHPLIFGSVNLVDGQLLRGSAISTEINFEGRKATIGYAHLQERDADISAGGEIGFEDIADVRLTLLPNVSLTPTMALSGEDCVNDVAFHASPAINRLGLSVNQINLRGGIFEAGWRISLRQENSLDSESAEQAVSPLTFPLCRDGKTLSLGLVPSLFP
ncbi:MAG TPA: hypothetical protein VJU77_12505 [Chthoniobacterales bacterium]|nr:hypothetical protein [Chthoniobacterales bacterium]